MDEISKLCGYTSPEADNSKYMMFTDETHNLLKNKYMYVSKNTLHRQLRRDCAVVPPLAC